MIFSQLVLKYSQLHTYQEFNTSNFYQSPPFFRSLIPLEISQLLGSSSY